MIMMRMEINTNGKTYITQIKRRGIHALKREIKRIIKDAFPGSYIGKVKITIEKYGKIIDESKLNFICEDAEVSFV